MIAAWLFLYLGGLVHVMAIYGLDLGNPRTAVLLLPLALVPFPALLLEHRPQGFRRVPTRLVAAIGLACALVFLRGINLDYWRSHYLPTSCLMAGMGIASFWVALSRPHLEDGPALWFRIGLWQLTGFLNPGLPLAGASVFAFLGAFGFLPPVPASPCPAKQPPAFPAALLLGLALAKPWWDYSANPGWAPDLAAWGLGVALSYLVAVRCAGARVPMALLNLGLALLFVAYTPELGWLWGLCLGLVWGWIWQRLPRPLPRERLTYGLALGFVLSFALHANLQLPVLRHLLWLGN
jgi:hypothetical protein